MKKFDKMPGPERMPYLKIYPDSLLNDEAYEDLTRADFGTVMLWAFEQIRRGGWLPADTKKLAKLGRIREHECRKLLEKWPKLQPCSQDSTKLGIPYITKQYEAFMQLSNQGKKAADIRWGNLDADALHPQCHIEEEKKRNIFIADGGSGTPPPPPLSSSFSSKPKGSRKPKTFKIPEVTAEQVEADRKYQEDLRAEEEAAQVRAAEDRARREARKRLEGGV